MNKICVFSGTGLGRKLSSWLSEFDNIKVSCSVATDYGQQVMEGFKGELLTGRMDYEAMVELFTKEKYHLVVDATHPFAVVVSENIKKATEACNIEYIRLSRDKLDSSGVKHFPDINSAIEYLKTTTGNILATTGSKEIASYSAIEDFTTRVYPRVLPMVDSINACVNAGFASSKIIAMQGPFTYAMNTALIKGLNISYLVTKESGGSSGFTEKIEAAMDCGVECLVIGLPPQIEGLAIEDLQRYIISKNNLTPKVDITIVGFGTGGEDYVTLAGREAIENADVIIGAKRLVESCSNINSNAIIGYRAEDVLQCIKENPHYRNITVVMSGDVGFYSGATKLREGLVGYPIKTICGISTPIYLSAKIGLPWQDMPMISLHGRDNNIIHYIKNNPRVFSLTGGEVTVRVLVDTLMKYGYGNLTIHVGELLSTPEEKITTSKVSDIVGREFHSISAVIIENPDCKEMVELAIEDESFLREDKVPMTKSEVRTLSIAKLGITANSVVYDIGAGSGSVAIQMAKFAYKGHVYAVERKKEAVALIKENAIVHKTPNVTTIEGLAPEAMVDLPVPTHAFIGGSAGNLADIVKLLLEKNPQVKIVLNAITPETLGEVTLCIKEFDMVSEIVSVNIAKSRKVGGYHLMYGQNPIFIVTFSKKSLEKSE